MFAPGGRAAPVRHHGERGGDENTAARCESVESIGQIDRIGSTCDDEHRKDGGSDPQRHDDADKGQKQPARPRRATGW